jgi:polar amino acid transport system substrate-binding protein
MLVIVKQNNNPTRYILRITYYVLRTSLLVMLFTACQADKDTWRRIEEAGVLRVGLDPTYPPFEVAEGENVQGVDVDLARAIARYLGLKVEFIYFGYDGLYDALITEQVDVLISALVIMPERMGDFAYSEPYFNAGQILVTPAETTPVATTDVGTTAIAEMADLNGRILAVELGSQGHVEAIKWARRLPTFTIQAHNSTDEALAAVAMGQADAALVDSVSGRLFLMHEPRLRRSNQPVSVEPYALVVRIEDRLLLTRINDSLEHLRTSGEMDKIIHQWLGK